MHKHSPCSTEMADPLARPESPDASQYQTEKVEGINVSILRPMLPEEWKDVLDGIEVGMVFHMEDTSIYPRYNHDNPYNDVEFRSYLDAIQANVELHKGRFPDCIQSILWQRFDVDPHCERSEYATFLCRLTDGSYGYFQAREGSCGYNTCPVGGSYASLTTSPSLTALIELVMTAADREHTLYAISIV